MKRIKQIILTIIAMMTMVCYPVNAADATINGTTATYASGQGGSASITINLPATVNGITFDNNTKYNYKVYKVFDATVGSPSEVGKNDASIAYTVPAGREVNDTNGMSTYFKVNGVNVTAKDNAKDNDGYLVSGAVQAIKKYLGLASGETGNAATAAQAVADVSVPPRYNSQNIASLTITGLQYGYYYITTTTGSAVIVNSTNPNAVVNDKNTWPTVDKKQSTDTGETKTYKDDAVNVEIGDTIYYQTTVTIPANADADITLTDLLSVGFIPNFTASAYNTESDKTKVTDEKPATINSGVTVQYKNGDSWTTLDAGSGEAVNYTIVPAWTTSDRVAINGFILTIKPTAATKGKTIKMEYSAKAGGSSVINDVDQNDQKRNQIELVYKTYHQKDIVYFHTFAAGVIKYDDSTAEVLSSGDNTDKLSAKEGKTIKYLPAAEFKLQSSSDSGTTWTDVKVVIHGAKEFYRPAIWTDDAKTTPYTGDNLAEGTGLKITPNNSGQIILRGLDSDKQYRLIETKAPDGYNKLAEPVSLTLIQDTKRSIILSKGIVQEVTEDSNDQYLEAGQITKIANTPGVALPSTGGIGTTIFYIGGGAIIIFAVVMLIMRRKRS